jgi:hypothetical protein
MNSKTFCCLITIILRHVEDPLFLHLYISLLKSRLFLRKKQQEEKGPQKEAVTIPTGISDVGRWKGQCIAIMRMFPPRRNDRRRRSVRTPQSASGRQAGNDTYNIYRPQKPTIPPTASAVMEMKTILVAFTFIPRECAI